MPDIYGLALPRCGPYMATKAIRLTRRAFGGLLATLPFVGLAGTTEAEAKRISRTTYRFWREKQFRAEFFTLNERAPRPQGVVLQ
jgi:hypothetical protein